MKGSAAGARAGGRPFLSVHFQEESLMNTKTRSATRDLVLTALFLALAFVLPMITGHVQIGRAHV